MTCSELINELNDAAVRDDRTAGVLTWSVRHNGVFAAARRGMATRVDYVIARLIMAWADYADLHHARYESRIGADGVLGPAWQAQGEALLTLLNGELGDLDAGACDRIVRAVLANEGCDVE